MTRKYTHTNNVNINVQPNSHIVANNKNNNNYWPFESCGHKQNHVVVGCSLFVACCKQNELWLAKTLCAPSDFATAQADDLVVVVVHTKQAGFLAQRDKISANSEKKKLWSVLRMWQRWPLIIRQAHSYSRYDVAVCFCFWFNFSQTRHRQTQKVAFNFAISKTTTTTGNTMQFYFGCCHKLAFEILTRVRAENSLNGNVVVVVVLVAVFYAYRFFLWRISLGLTPRNRLTLIPIRNFSWLVSRNFQWATCNVIEWASTSRYVVRKSCYINKWYWRCRAKKRQNLRLFSLQRDLSLSAASSYASVQTGCVI